MMDIDAALRSPPLVAERVHCSCELYTIAVGYSKTFSVLHPVRSDIFTSILLLDQYSRNFMPCLETSYQSSQ